MAERNDPFNVRLPGDLGRRFSLLRQKIDLPAGMILRLLVSDQLQKPLDEQVKIVIGQLRKGRKPAN